MLEILVGIAAIIGTVILWNQHREAQRVNKIAHKPVLEFFTLAGSAPKPDVRIVLKNVGSGRATVIAMSIETLTTFLDVPGEEWKIPQWDAQTTPTDASDWRQILQTIDMGAANYVATALSVPKFSLAANTEELVLKLHGANNLDLDRKTHEAYRWMLQYRLRIELKYRGDYDDEAHIARFGAYMYHESDLDTPVDMARLLKDQQHLP